MSKYRNWSFIGIITFIIAMLFVGLGPAKLPLILAFILAYLTFPVLLKMESWGMNRLSSAAVLLSVLISGFILFGILVVPILFHELKGLIEGFPEFLSSSISFLEKTLMKFNIEVSLDSSEVIAMIESHLPERDFESITRFIGGTVSNFKSIVFIFINLFVFPIFLFYIVYDFENIRFNMRSLVPNWLEPKINRYREKLNTILSGYIHGSILMALILSVIMGVSLQIIGLRFGLLIGFITGILSIIPYVGFGLGFLVSMIVITADFSMGVLIGILVVFGVVQSIQGYLLIPRLVGNKVGLNDLSTILALIIGGNLAGLFGMLIALPVAGILKFALQDLFVYYKTTEFYKGNI